MSEECVMVSCVMVSCRRRLNGNIMLRDQPDWATNPQVQLIDFEYSDFNLRAFDIGRSPRHLLLFRSCCL